MTFFTIEFEVATIGKRGKSRRSLRMLCSLVNGARPLIMDSSTARRITPAGSFVLSVLDNARHRGVALRKGKHLYTPRAIGLRIIINERNAL
jgi:hypothetical protein